jgi:hypothetical protein
MTSNQETIVLNALDQEDKLTGNEWDFINRLADNDGGWPLSDKQRKWLLDIGEKLDDL